MTRARSDLALADIAAVLRVKQRIDTLLDQGSPITPRQLISIRDALTDYLLSSCPEYRARRAAFLAGMAARSEGRPAP